MSKLNSTRRRTTFAAFACAVVIAATALPFTTASCSSQQPRADEPQAFERLRTMTRGDKLPPEETVASIVTDYSGSRTGALARILQARIRLEAKDFAGAANLVDSKDLARHTAVADHALWMRAESLEKAGRRVEARAALEQLVRDYPDSLRSRDATLRAAEITFQSGQAAAVPAFLAELVRNDDPQALLLTGKALEQSNKSAEALAAFRKLYFYTAATAQTDGEAEAAMKRLSPFSADPSSGAEALAQAEKLFKSKRHLDAYNAYSNAISRFVETSTPQEALRRGIAASNARLTTETVSALNAIPTSAGEIRAEALHTLVLYFARLKQWPYVRGSIDTLRREFAKSDWTMRALVGAGLAAKEAKNLSDASYFFRTATIMFPGSPEVAGAQFETAWAAHEANNFSEASRLLTEHLANYADRNTDNRGKAGYWAARDSERAGRLAEARALFEAMLERYDASWYGYLARKRLDALKSTNSRVQATTLSPEVTRAIANLKPIWRAQETAGPEDDMRITRAAQLDAVGLSDSAHAELDQALEKSSQSPRLNLAKAKIYRSRNDNVQAFNVLRRSYPDYSQMEPEELTQEEWDVFYPMAYWDIIAQESRARSLDPYTVAGLIRQESVFNPRAVSSANAYGLMQLLIPTARLTAKRYGLTQGITVDSLFDPRTNIHLGAAYLKDQMDTFGRIEYVAAAYNAGPGRAVAWRASLPLQIDEWAEAIPFRETRGYVQGVVRNTLQYRRLYDEQGRFRSEIGTRAGQSAQAEPSPAVRPRRFSSNEDE